MLEICKNSIIYIICPSNNATGGPEALHQLGEELIKQGFRVYMNYMHYEEEKFNTPIHDFYLHYNVPYTFEIENAKQNLVIFPETFCTYLWETKFSNLQKIVWWLSVTNFTISHKLSLNFHKKNVKFFILKQYFKNYPIPSIENVKKTNAIHLAHSYFSLDFLRTNNFNILGQVSDYMNSQFLEGNDYRKGKENLILYNPVKNSDFLEKIKLKTNSLNWIAIEKMTPLEVANLMKRAKIYIDFGYHPGKERMPREACLLDCCLIIGKDGSAKYKEDMPIKDEYHFEKQDQNIPQIINQIRICLENYDVKINDFSDYKNILLKEKETFSTDVKRIFKIKK